MIDGFDAVDLYMGHHFIPHTTKPAVGYIMLMFPAPSSFFSI
jgi:hypothetical protein